MRAHGIDISKGEGYYSPVANPPRPVQFVIQRLSYGLTVDEKISVLTKPTLSAPIKGAYHYLTSSYTWKEQADFFIKLFRTYAYDFWAWDIEKLYNSPTKSFINGIVPALEYLAKVIGKPGLVYMNPDTWGTWLVPIQNDIISVLNRPALNIGLWVAQYTLPEEERNPEAPAVYFNVNGAENMPKNWKFWQYDDHGEMGRGGEYGVGSDGLDLNVFNGSFQDLKFWAKGLGGKMNILPVSYVSQLLTGALEHNNDCGSASSLMLLNTYGLAKEMTVDAFYNSIVPSGDLALSTGAMQTKMASLGLKTDYKVSMTPELVFSNLRAKKPILALVHYAPLVAGGYTQKTGFTGAHFLVITGIDLDNVFINDPYRDDGKTDIAVPITVFMQAWAECTLDNNPVGSCLIPQLPIQNLLPPTPVPTGDTYALLVNGLNVRAGAGSNYTLLRVIWRSTEPTIKCSGSIINGYIQLADKSGWVFAEYIKKV